LLDLQRLSVGARFAPLAWLLAAATLLAFLCCSLAAPAAALDETGGGHAPETHHGRAPRPADLVAEFGADPTGARDSAAACNAAAATGRSIYLPKGDYRFTHMCTLGPGQTLTGDGKDQVTIRIAPDFDMSAEGVIKFGHFIGGQVRDISFFFKQPDVTTAIVTGSVEGAVLTVSEVASGAIAIGDAVHWGPPNLGPQGAWIVAQISGAPGGAGAYRLNQPYTAPSTRIQMANDTAFIHYPPAIFGRDATRYVIDHVMIGGAWKCVTLIGNAGMGRIGVLECGGMTPDGAVTIDGAHGDVFIDHLDCWPFGFSNRAFLAVLKLQKSVCAYFGRVDQLAVNAIGVLHQTVHFGGKPIGIPYHVSTLGMDNNGADILVDGGAIVQIDKVYMGKNTTERRAPIEVAGKGSRLRVTQLEFAMDGVKRCSLHATSGGTLEIMGGYSRHLDPATPFGCADSGGQLAVSNMWNTVAGARTAAYFDQSGPGSVIRLVGNDFSFVGASPGYALSVADDTLGNLVASNNFNGWAVSMPFASSKGMYDTGSAAKFTPTITPSFVAKGDFSPSHVVADAWYVRKGDFVEEYVDARFDANAFTTAGGAFYLQSSAPTAIADSAMGCALARMENVAFGPSSFVSATRVAGGYWFWSSQSGGASAPLGVAAIRPSRNGIRVTLSCRYRVK
jgi:hypothetical protein